MGVEGMGNVGAAGPGGSAIPPSLGSSPMMQGGGAANAGMGMPQGNPMQPMGSYGPPPNLSPGAGATVNPPAWTPGMANMYAGLHPQPMQTGQPTGARMNPMMLRALGLG